MSNHQLLFINLASVSRADGILFPPLRQALNVGCYFLDKTYIQFKTPLSEKEPQHESVLMRYFKKLTIDILTKIFRIANPDFEGKIDDVTSWFVKRDNQSGIPEREVGIDEYGQVKMIMPFRHDCGYWTDNNMLLNDFQEHLKTLEITRIPLSGFGIPLT